MRRIGTLDLGTDRNVTFVSLLQYIREITPFEGIIHYFRQEVTFTSLHLDPGPWVYAELKAATFFTAGLYNAGMNDDSDSQPNILLITASQSVTPLAGDDASGGLDELARRGMTFTNAYTVAPHEHGSWLSLMTGQYPQRWGVFGEESSDEWTSPDREITDLLSEAGYTISTTFEPQFTPVPFFSHITVSAESVDVEVAHALELLDDSEATDDTLIIYTSLTPAPDELDLSIPLIIAWPEVVPGGTTSDSLTSILDVAPTILAAAGVDTSPTGISCDGLDLTPVMTENLTAHKTLFHSTGRTWTARTGGFVLRGGTPLTLVETGSDVDVSTDYPHIADTLIEQYVRWKDHMAHGPLS